MPLHLVVPIVLAGDLSFDAVAVMNEPDCPALCGMFDDRVRDALPKERTARLCNGARITGLFVGEPPAVRDVHAPLLWPLAEETLVFWGGDSAATNYHIENPQQRRALDLLVVNDAGRSHQGDGKKNEDYFVYAKAVRAAAPGTVAVAIDGVPDNPPGLMNGYFAPGNLLIVDHGEGDFAWYAHLKPGSLRVKRGDAVKAGDELARVGNSGNTSEPHLHFHVQDNVVMPMGYGIAPVFAEVTVVRDGKRAVRSGYRPLKGDRVKP